VSGNTPLQVVTVTISLFWLWLPRDVESRLIDTSEQIMRRGRGGVLEDRG